LRQVAITANNGGLHYSGGFDWFEHGVTLAVPLRSANERVGDFKFA
jgi:hypothetical protein